MIIYALQLHYQYFVIDDTLGASIDYTTVTVLPSVPPTGVVTSHSLVAGSEQTTKVTYEFQLRHRT